jgi:hypothetical protein
LVSYLGEKPQIEVFSEEAEENDLRGERGRIMEKIT